MTIPGLYPGPGIYAGPGFYLRFYGTCVITDASREGCWKTLLDLSGQNGDLLILWLSSYVIDSVTSEFDQRSDQWISGGSRKLAYGGGGLPLP